MYNTNKFNSKTNYAYYKSTATNSCFTNAEMPKSSSGARVLGKFSSSNVRETGNQYGRNSSDMLNAFNSNPYTHSLSSTA